MQQPDTFLRLPSGEMPARCPVLSPGATADVKRLHVHQVMRREAYFIAMLARAAYSVLLLSLRRHSPAIHRFMFFIDTAVLLCAKSFSEVPAAICRARFSLFEQDYTFDARHERRASRAQCAVA